MLSIVVLTRNRKDLNPRTIPSVGFADEVIVQECGIISDWSAVRNDALAKTKGDWVLFVDSDEVVSDKLSDEIKAKIKGSKYQGYFLKRLDNFWAKTLRFGEAGNTKLLRLAKKDAGSWERKVHEVWNVKGSVGELNNPLEHFPHPTIFKFILNINHHTDIDAQELSREGKRFNYLRVILNPLGKFLTNYLLKLGFLDGQVGFIYAYMMSLHSLTVRVKQYAD